VQRFVAEGLQDGVSLSRIEQWLDEYVASRRNGMSMLSMAFKSQDRIEVRGPKNQRSSQEAGNAKRLVSVHLS
jgi:hypothetical protein